MADYRHWPQLLREIAERVGEAEALRLAGSLGGQRITVPTRAEGSKLAREHGLPVAEILVEMYGGGIAPVPNFKARIAAERRRVVLQNPSAPTNDLASSLGISYRRVQQIREEAEAGPRQPSLFGG